MQDNVTELIESALARLAYWWREACSRDDVVESEMLAQQHKELLLCLMKWGWADILDSDSELPDELLPGEYLRLRGGKSNLQI